MARETIIAATPEAAEGVDEVEPPIAAPDAAALALAMRAPDEALSARAGAYFEQQTRYVHTLLEHLHEQRAVQIALLELRRTGEWLRLGVQFLVTVAIGFAVFYGIVLLYDALNAHALIVSPFPTPPALAERGLTPTVLGNAVLDRLETLRRDGRSTLSGHTLAASWADKIELEVPETGISLDQIARLLRHRFGHDTQIGGDLVQNQDGTVTLTIRGDGMEARRFSGREAAVSDLVQLATEYAYGAVEPALYAIYLTRRGRNAEAIAFARRAVLSVAPTQRAYLYNAWAVALGNSGAPLAEQFALEERAITERPDFWVAVGNAMIDARAMGAEERAWKIGQALPAAGRKSGVPAAAYTTWFILTENSLALRDALRADAVAHGGIGSSAIADTAQIAQADADLHDPVDARLRLLSLDPHDPNSAAAAAYTRGVLAEQAGRLDEAVQALETYRNMMSDPAISGGDTSFHCDVARAELLAGRNNQAAAELAAGGHFVDCLRLRGDLLDETRQTGPAIAAYHNAIAAAPDLPAGYLSLGQALARRGDWQAARRALRAAIKRGPHWAEPEAALGDLEAERRHWFAAVSAYDHALADAPQWDALTARRAAARAHY